MVPLSAVCGCVAAVPRVRSMAPSNPRVPVRSDSPALCPKIAPQPVHGMGVEIGARGMGQVWVHVQRFGRGDALEHW